MITLIFRASADGVNFTFISVNCNFCPISLIQKKGKKSLNLASTSFWTSFHCYNFKTVPWRRGVNLGTEDIEFLTIQLFQIRGGIDSMEKQVLTVHWKICKRQLVEKTVSVTTGSMWNLNWHFSDIRNSKINILMLNAIPWGDGIFF